MRRKKEDPPKPAKPWLNELKTKEQRLLFVKCFVFEGREVIGPVSMLAVEDMIEHGELAADTQVMICGGDVWRPFHVEAHKICPEENFEEKCKRIAQERSTFVYYSLTGEDVKGPVLLSQVLIWARIGELPNGTKICKAGSEKWIPLEIIPP